MKLITYQLAFLFASAINHDAMQSNKVKTNGIWRRQAICENDSVG